MIDKQQYFNGTNQYIQLRHDVIKWLLKDIIISYDYIKLKMNLADPLTKSFGRKMIFEKLRGIKLMLIEKSK